MYFPRCFVLLLAVLLLAACSDVVSDTGRRPGPESPDLMVEPEPGRYGVSRLAVRITAPSEAHELWFDYDRTPVAAGVGHKGEFEVLLSRSTRLHVVVVDPRGREWGPFIFQYLLQAESKGKSACVIIPEADMVNGAETVTVAVEFSRSTELDRFYLTIDGEESEVAREALDETGAFSFTAGPWPEGGVQEFGCRVAGANPFVGRGSILVDATPPALAWNTAGGSVGRSDWPVDLSFTAADAESGLLDVLVCTSSACQAGWGVGDGIFELATAFTTGTDFAVEVTVSAQDRVGNKALLAPLIYGVDFVEPPANPLAGLTATTLPVVSVSDFLPSTDPVGEIYRVGAFGAALDPVALTLNTGWNDYVYRRSGKNEWESFAVYRMGFRAELPALGAPWSAYASNATIPAWQGRYLGPVSGSTFNAGWWDIPHVWFVADHDGDGTWSGGDTVCAPAADARDDKWAWQAEARVFTADELSCHDSVEADERAFTVFCNDCAVGGRLYAEARQGWAAFPLYHGAATDVTAPTLVTGATLSVPVPNESLCIFFWDENANAVADGREARSFGGCDMAVRLLSRQEGVFGARLAGEEIVIAGLPYGVTAHASLELHDDRGAWLRRPLELLRDGNGTGVTHLSLPDDLPGGLPWRLRVTEPTGVQHEAEVVSPSAATSQTLWFQVFDENAEQVTNDTAVLLSGSEGTYGFLLAGGGAVAPVPVGIPAIGSLSSAVALREGYLSRQIALGATTVTLQVLGADSVGTIAGRVEDSLGPPVSFAHVSWSASPWYSETMADGEGRFSLPALGDGWLMVRGPLPQQVASRNFIMLSDSRLEGIRITVPAHDDSVARGLLGDAASTWVGGVGEPIDTIIDGPYYYASVTGGVYTHHVGDMQRRFVVPGFLPSYTTPLFYEWVPAPPSVGWDVAQYVACGDRRQQTGGGTIIVDGPCWQWFVEVGPERYFLGNVDAGASVDPQPRFGDLRIDIAGLADDTLVLADRFFNRTIRLPLVDTRAEGVVPVGAYDVALSDGTPVADGQGKPARVQVIGGGTSGYSLPAP